MRRRALLAALGLGTAGCVGAPGTGRLRTGTRTDESSSGDAEYRITDLSVETSTDAPSVRFVLEPDAFYSADAVEREREHSDRKIVVLDVSEIEDPAVRDLVTTAIRDGEWRGNDLPDGTVDLLDRVDFFTGVSEDDTYTHVGLALHRLHPDRPPAIEFDARVVDSAVSADDPGTLELSLSNVGEERQKIGAGTVPPFGMVYARGEAGKFLLWRPYEEEGCISFSDDGAVVCMIGTTTPLEPGERLAREYDVLPTATSHHPRYTAPPGAGDYRIGQKVGYSAGNGAPESTLSFEVGFALE